MEAGQDAVGAAIVRDGEVVSPSTISFLLQLRSRRIRKSQPFGVRAPRLAHRSARPHDLLNDRAVSDVLQRVSLGEACRIVYGAAIDDARSAGFSDYP